MAWRATLPCLVLLALSACGSGGALGPAIDAYYGLEGGAIAAQRPPPPGADDPYPNLGSVPARPAAPDVAAQQRIADRLASQRDEAEAAAVRAPLTALPPPPATAKAAAPDPNGNRVTLDAAAAPPTPAVPAVKTAAAGPGISAVPAVPTAIASGPVPSLADAPPPAPIGLGVAAAPPNVAPAAPPAGAEPAAAANPAVVQVDFTPGSAALPPSATHNLRRFALAHRGVPITVTGRGGDVLPGADPQARALELALRRAQAMAASLGTAGVPAANLRLRAEAAGQGGAARL